MPAPAIRSDPPDRRPSGPTRLFLAVVPVALVAWLGSAATLPNIPGWYAGLAKPPFTPPNGVFGPAWGVFYGLLAFAAWRILGTPRSATRTAALGWFAVQLGLNALWSWLFFAGRNPAAGLVDITLLLAAIGLTIRAVRRVDRPAAWATVPYAAWVAFALYLNAGIWRLNG